MQGRFKDVRTLYDDATTFKSKGNDYFASKNYMKAKKQYHCALLQTRAISARDTVGRSMSFFDGAINSELKYSESADFKSAVENLECSCNKNLAMIFISEGRWEKALEYSRKALEFDENDEKALYRFSLAAINLDLIDDCTSTTERLLELKPESKLYIKMQADLRNKVNQQKSREKRLYQGMFLSN